MSIMVLVFANLGKVIYFLILLKNYSWYCCIRVNFVS